MRGGFFAAAIIALSLGASVSYFCNKDWWHGLYWACAAGIGYSVLRMH